MNAETTSPSAAPTEQSIKRDLAKVKTQLLIDELVHRLNENEVTYEDLEDLAPEVVNPDEVIEAVEDYGALEEARARWKRGDRREALVQLGYALGRDFMDLGDLRPEHLA